MRTPAFLAAALAAAALAGRVFASPENAVFAQIQRVAGWLAGGPKPEVVTWPVWGYAWLVSLLPSLAAVVAIQAAVGALALTLLARALCRDLPRHATAVTVLLLLAVPWHSLQPVLYPHALAGSFTLLALLALGRALSGGRPGWAVAGGVLMGIAQNFRTEFVLLPAFIVVSLLAARAARITAWRSPAPAWIFAAVALVMQLPWAAFYHAQTGRFSLGESNFGHVLYVSMGSRPDNPWDVKGDDESAQQAVTAAGRAVWSPSDEGSRVLVGLVARMAAEHPMAVVARTAQQLRNTAAAPFNWGEPHLVPDDARDLDVLREELKSRVGAGVNRRQLEEYRRDGAFDRARRNGTALLALGYQVATVGFGAAMLALGVCGMAVYVLRARAAPPAPLLALLALAAIYKVLQDVLLCYQVNYLNNVYPMFVPFACIAASSAVERVRQTHGGPR